MHRNLDQFIKFLQIPSISLDTAAVNKALDYILDYFSDIKDKLNIHTFYCNNKRSLLITPEAQRFNKLKIILNGHADVVDAPIEFFSPKIKGDKIYARGAYDMKGGLFAGMIAFKKLIKANNNLPIGLQVVPDEEIGGFDGTLCQLKKGVRSQFMVALEPSNLNITIAAKGVLWIEVLAHGKAAHSGYPWNGQNAIKILVDFINALDKHFPNPTKKAWQTTYNLSQISTPNKTMNKIPDKAILKVDIRYVPSDKTKLEELFMQIRDKMPIDLNYLMFEPAFHTSTQDKYIKALVDVLKTNHPTFKYEKRHGSSDVRHFAKYEIPGIEFGPTGFGSHQADEYVEWSSILELAKILEEWILKVV